MLYLSIAAIVIILAIAYKNEVKSFFGKLKPKKKEVSTFREATDGDSKHNSKNDSECNSLLLFFISVSIIFTMTGIAIIIKDASEAEPQLKKEVVLTISNVKEDSKNGCKYVKFSDGHTLKISKESGDKTKWIFAKEGDKVRKLIYENKELKYTPEFDDDINKDSVKK